ncbi:recombination regulator RecX [Kitasatospora sp. RB6PN24]|nr:recombination regulator RecX [Kitasatospora humi]MCC9309186.1 recombination regulator RecX [Kitasatospora humi]
MLGESAQGGGAARVARPVGEWVAEGPARGRRAGGVRSGDAARSVGERSVVGESAQGGGAAGAVRPIGEWVAEGPARGRRAGGRGPAAGGVRPVREEPSVAPAGDWVAEAEAELAAASARSRRGRSRRAESADGAPRTQRTPQPDTDPATRAREICLRLLTGTARTRKQLADALRKREVPDEVAEEVLSRFEEVGLIDDAAFAAAWVESRHAGRGLARRALARELRTRGVASPVVEEAVAQLDADDEAAAARALVDRKLRATTGVERQARIRRLVGMLARRGYPEGLAFRVVREALEAEGESAEELEDWSLG